MRKPNKKDWGGYFVIEAFITWEDGTTSTITARDWGELFTLINSSKKQILTIDTHLTEGQEEKR